MLTLVIVLAAAVTDASAVMNPPNCGLPAIPPKLCNQGCWRLQEDLDGSHYRIVGGMEAKVGSWPWTVQLKVDGKHYCAGAILDDSTIVTAAHVFYKYGMPGNFKVHAGSHDKMRTDAAERVYSVLRIIKHPRYQAGQLDNDIALIKIEGKFAWSDHISPVCVGNREPVDFSFVYATGWGATSGTGSDSKLKQIRVPVYKRTECNFVYGGSVTRNMICAGFRNTGGHSICDGDSGGPLVQSMGSNPRWRLYGIASSGRCGLDGYPSVFTNVANYAPWIQARLAT